jgi:glycosyltransferase involved in cell wall biosynthesis
MALMRGLRDLVRLRRRRVLVVDQGVPTPDQDAGSRTIFQVLCLFAAKGFEVHFWAPERKAESRYGDVLRARGINVEVLDPVPSPRFRRWLKREGRKIDVVFLSRPQVAAQVIDLVRKFCVARVLFYGHDLHHLRLRMGLAQTGRASDANRADAIEGVEKDIWGKVDVAFYPSPEECAYVSAHGRACGHRIDSRVLPVFGFDAFEEPSPSLLPARSGVLFVGGFGHAPNVDGMLWFAREVWPAVTSARPDVRLTIVGSRAPSDILALAGETVDVRGFIPDDALELAYRSARVAIAPLRFGAGMKGKVVEAMRFGVPMVTTVVGAQGLADAGDALLVSDDARTQAELVLALLADDGHWERTASAATAFARQRFSRDRLWSALEAAF